MSLFDQDTLFDNVGDIYMPPPVPTPPPGYLGRFQAGQTVPLSVSPVDGAGYPTPPDRPPIAVVTDPDGHATTIALAMRGGNLVFGCDFFLGSAAILGTYTIGYSYVVAGTPGTATGSFDVIIGGDLGGAVIALYAYARPEAQYVVAQLSSGMLAMGKNPSI